MKHRIYLFVGLAVVSAGVFLGNSGQAGFKTYGSVVVTTSKAAFSGAGDLGYARNSNLAEEHLGCSLTGTSAGLTASCDAMNGAGIKVSCATTNPNMVAAVQSLNGDSRLEFQGTPSMVKGVASACTSILVRNSSTTQPK